MNTKRLNIFLLLAAIATVGLVGWRIRSKSGRHPLPNNKSKTETVANVKAGGRDEEDQGRSVAAGTRKAQMKPARPNANAVTDAQQPTPRGRRPDPKEFWANRTIWLDKAAVTDAHKLGRLYPPIPYGVRNNFQLRSDEDRTTTADPDGLGGGLHYTDREYAFWDTFSRTHPIPPDGIAAGQISAAKHVVEIRHLLNNTGGAPASLTEREFSESEQIAIQRALAAGIPPEALSEDALRWAYTLGQRNEYSQDYVQTHLENTLWASNFLARTRTSHKLITEPLTDAQLKAANAWKLAYLQRLRSEKTNETYIAAYLKAWNLSEADVFGTSSGQ